MAAKVVQYKPKPRPSNIISQTVPLNVTDNTSRSSSFQGIFGPPTPGKSWDQYEKEVSETILRNQQEELANQRRNNSRFNLQQIGEPEQPKPSPKRPKSILNEEVELAPVNENADEQEKKNKEASGLSPEVTTRNQEMLAEAMEKDPRWKEVQDSMADMDDDEREEKEKEREESSNELKSLPDAVRSIPEKFVGFIGNVGDTILHPDKLFNDTGVLNPDNWPLIGSTQRDRQVRQERQEYRDANPMPEGAINPDGTTGQSMRSVYESIPGWMQGENNRSDYNFGEVVSDMNTTYQDENGVWHVAANPSGRNYWDELTKPVGWFAEDSIDDGSMTRESLLAPNMTTEQYIKYRQAGVPGRPIEELLANPDAVWNKRDEQFDYNFVPYVEDTNQLQGWSLRNMARDTSNLFKEFGDLREDWTDATIHYNGDQYSRDDMYRNIEDWYNSSLGGFDMQNIEYLAPGDPRIDGTYAPMVRDLLLHLPDDDVVINTPYENIHLDMTGNGDEVMASFDGVDDALFFDTRDEAIDFFNNDSNYEFRSKVAEEGEQPNAYAQFPTLEYDQADGKHVSLSYPEVNELMEMRENNTLPIDYGPFNIAKDANEREGLWENLSQGNIGGFLSDLPSTFTDMSLQSAPFWFKKAFIPMSIADAASTLQNLDQRSYDSDTGAMMRKMENPTGPAIMQESAAAIAQPAFERIAGNLGGRGISRALTGKVLGNNVERIPYPLRYGAGAVGEGWEEPISSINEEAARYPLSMMYANPVDENGNPIEEGQDPVYSNATGLELRDPNTPLSDRFANWFEQAPEDFLGGLMLGTPFSALKMKGDMATGQGAVGDYRDYRAQKAFDKAAGLKTFRRAREENPGTRVYIRPEDIGSYDPNETLRRRDANSLRNQ